MNTTTHTPAGEMKTGDRITFWDHSEEHELRVTSHGPTHTNGWPGCTGTDSMGRSRTITASQVEWIATR